MEWQGRSRRTSVKDVCWGNLGETGENYFRLVGLFQATFLDPFVTREGAPVCGETAIETYGAGSAN